MGKTTNELMEIHPRIALTLSGGGFRASIFHLGVLRRLAEQGWLDKIDAISTVSGGSILGAFAVLRWDQMLKNGGNWPALKEYIVDPFLDLVQNRNFIMDWSKRVPFVLFKKKDKTYTRTKLAAQILGKRFYANKMCDELPERPILILNATCMKSIRSWRFTKDGLGDSRFGYADWNDRALSIGEGVGASAAFPPVFTPTRINGSFYQFSGPVYKEEAIDPPQFFSLSDGGVYENLGTEVLTKENGTQIPIRKKVMQAEYLIVSDAGYPPQYRFRRNGIPLISEIFLLYRVDDIARTQVNALRIRQLIKKFCNQDDPLKGILVSLVSTTGSVLQDAKSEYYQHVGLEHEIPEDLIKKIKAIRTHLDKFSPIECEALMYDAYTIADAAIWNFRAQNPPQYEVDDTPNPNWKIKFTENLKKEWGEALAESGKLRILNPR